MKYKRTMPADDERTYKLVSEGEKKFQITDIYKEDETEITVKAEVISDVDRGETMFHRVSNDPSNKFFWLTKLFLKCVGCAYEGDVTIDTDEFIGRQFWGEVKHSKGNDGKTYANIRKLIFMDEAQPVKSVNPGGVVDPEQIQWDA